MTAPEPNFTGHPGRQCGEHRTVGPHRAWCFDCSEWCCPARPDDAPLDGACLGCRVPWLEARLGEALADLATLRGRTATAEHPAAAPPAHRWHHDFGPTHPQEQS